MTRTLRCLPVSLSIFLAAVLSYGCSDDYGSPVDVTPPAAITDLAVSASGITSAALLWTAPGDDGTTGTASTYDVRYTTTPLTDADWDEATQVEAKPSPSAAGTSEALVVSGLSSTETYYFAVKTADEIPNWSDLSNVVAVAFQDGQGARVR